MSSSRLNGCPCCGTDLTPQMGETPQEKRQFSLGLWAYCPGCDLRGPTTWITLDEAEVVSELERGQSEAAQAWNVLASNAGLGRQVAASILNASPETAQ